MINLKILFLFVKSLGREKFTSSPMSQLITRFYNKAGYELEATSKVLAIGWFLASLEYHVSERRY